MPPRKKRFLSTALAGYAAVIALLAIGVALTVQRLDDVADRQFAQIREDGREIRLAERLREIGLHIVSAERGYLLSRDPELLARMSAAQADFDTTLRALEKGRFAARDGSLVAEVDRSSADFRRVGQEILAAVPAESGSQLVSGFETELLPRERSLVTALDRLVEHERRAIALAFEEANRERDDAASWMLGLLGLAVVGGFAIAWYFTRQLARMYRREQDARALAQQAVAARDEVMAIVAHDLREPLGAIVLKATLLERDARPGPARRQAASIANIAMRTEYLIEAMLEVGAIEDRRLEPARSTCAVDELVQSTTEMFREAAASKSVQLAVHGGATGLAVQADRDQVLRALSILVGNAIKFGPSGSEVTVTAAPDGPQVRFAVSDRGPGISGERLARVFDRFGTDERTKHGAGLGLFVARGIAEAHGGRAWAESESGQGATFNLTLPLGDASILPEHAPAA